MDQFADLSSEALAAAREERFSAFQDLLGLESPTPEQVTEAENYANEIDEIDAETARREAAQVEAAEKFAALKSRSFGTQEPEATEEAPEAPAEEPAQEQPETPAEEVVEQETEEAAVEQPTEEPAEAAVEAAPAPETAQPVAASTTTTSARRTVAARVQRPTIPEKVDMPLSITASANVEGFTAGQALNDLSEVTEAVIAKAKSFAAPSGDGTREDLQKFGVASFAIDNEFVIDRHMSDDAAMGVMLEAAKESRLEGESLVAAGGWCAPSETMYDLAADESTEGLISLPEVQIRRGGIRYTTGPQFADFYAQAGFIQTEAQAIAGATKPCYEVDCPDFTEVRLDAVGLCIKVPILTNAAYPELVTRFTSGTLIAHQHMVSANVITRMLALSGAARTFTGLGATATDALEALELVANQRRQTYRLSMTRSMEVVLPFWVKAAMRADLSRRFGVATEVVTDEMLQAHFAARNLNVQFVYNWQDLPTVDDAGTVGADERNVYPATYEALVYPAGTFVKGVSDVINLSDVYDAASLAVNVYTGLFVEQGLLVAKMQYDADRVVLPVCNAGRSGAANITCA